MEWLCEFILTSLQASNQSSGNARRQSANWKLLIWCGRLSAWICLDLQKHHHMHSACCISASGRDERDILDNAKLVCTFSQPLQMLSPKALCKCMHECLTQALIRTVAGFTKSRLIFFRESFKYKLCDTNSSDLSVWSSFAPFYICTAVPNRLPVLAFADSKRSHCKWISNDSKPLLNWFGGMPSAPNFSTILPQKLESHWTGKVALLVLKEQSHGHVRQILHWGPLIALGFGSRLVFSIIIENRFNWRKVVPGNVSLPVV